MNIAKMMLVSVIACVLVTPASAQAAAVPTDQPPLRLRPPR